MEELAFPGDSCHIVTRFAKVESAGPGLYWKAPSPEHSLHLSVPSCQPMFNIYYIRTLCTFII